MSEFVYVWQVIVLAMASLFLVALNVALGLVLVMFVARLLGLPLSRTRRVP